ncbi:MAG TPA: DUF6226 family protein [Pseudonocardiaceae bacterium]|nr:DUF6226 family protein [Pseudonocardiaceae bacterium]
MTGRRTDSTPEGAYRRVTNPDRFGPLHEIARRHLGQLEARYDVVRQTFTEADPHGSAPAAGVRLVPRDAAAAPLAVVFDAFPGVLVRCGRQDADGVHLPRCGCDACAESVVDCAEEFAGLIDATISGSFGERLIQDDGAWWHEEWYRTPTWSGGGRSRLETDQLAVLRKAVPAGGSAWAPWTERSERG